MLQDEILSISEYFRGIEYFNEALIVKVIFPQRWQVYPSKEGNIKPAQGGDTQGEYYYYGNMNAVSLDDIFSLIKETITANKDAELKIHLLNSKIDELKELFKAKSYEELLTLRFAFDEKKKEAKPKRKYTRKKKEAPEEPVKEEQPKEIEENNENENVVE